MPPLENPAHERFALEYAKQGNATQAYLIVYGGKYDNARSNASRLLAANDSIRGRLDELQEAVAEQVVAEHGITAAGQIAKLEEIVKAAQPLKQLAAGVSAIVAQSKLAGIWIEQSESRNLNVQYVISDRPKTSEEWAKRFCGED